MDAKKDVRDPEFIKKIKKSINFFYRTRKRISKDDLFQSVYLKFLEGKNDSSTIDQVCFDVYRDLYGRDTGTKSYQKRIQLDGAASFESLEHEVDYSKCWDWEKTLDSRQELEKILASITDIRLKTIFLLYAQDYLLVEIAEMFGVSEAYISLLMIEARPRLIRKWRKENAPSPRNESKKRRNRKNKRRRKKARVDRNKASA